VARAKAEMISALSQAIYEYTAFREVRGNCLQPLAARVERRLSQN
jgi:hypothetical protein